MTVDSGRAVLVERASAVSSEVPGPCLASGDLFYLVYYEAPLTVVCGLEFCVVLSNDEFAVFLFLCFPFDFFSGWRGK